jgi:hypothetical protein
MSEHTPGPWILSDETEHDRLRSKLIYGRPEGMLAIVRVEHQGGYYGDANARLIAAAPDMLAALKVAREGLSAALVRTGLDDVIAAIAKAGG